MRTDVIYPLRDVEILRIGGQDEEPCTNPTDLPSELERHVAAFVGGEPIVCGGYMSNHIYSDKCFVYSLKDKEWVEGPTLPYFRMEASSVLIDEYTWWINGGFRSGRRDPILIII